MKKHGGKGEKLASQVATAETQPASAETQLATVKTQPAAGESDAWQTF